MKRRNSTMARLGGRRLFGCWGSSLIVFCWLVHLSFAEVSNGVHRVEFRPYQLSSMRNNFHGSNSPWWEPSRHASPLSSLLRSKPSPSDAAATARWLAANNVWGVLSTISSDLGGAPFGNVVSYSDGLPGDGQGIPYFYLTTLDPTARNALKDARSSFTISEFPLGTCGKRDPENPTCAKLTLTGKLELLDETSGEAVFAKQFLFSKHSEMQSWPADHNFQIFKLAIEDLFLIDWFGGPKPLSLNEYLETTTVEHSAVSVL